MATYEIPRGDIEEVARQALRSDIEQIKADGLRLTEKAVSTEQRVAATEKALAEIDRVHQEDTARQTGNDGYAGLNWDPTDASSPAVKYFGLHYRRDVMVKHSPRRQEAGPQAIDAQGKGLRAGLYLQAMSMAVQTNRTIEDALKHLGANWMIRDLEAFVEREKNAPRNNSDVYVTREKALGTVNAGAGGTLLPAEYSSEWIDLLRNQTVFMEAGPDQIVLPPGGLNMGRWTAASTAQYRNETETVNASQPTTGELTLVPRELFGIVPAADRLLRVPSAEVHIRNEMIRTAAVRLDFAALRGDGTENTPKGLRFWATDGSDPDRIVPSAASTATPSTAELSADMENISFLAKQSNVHGGATAVFVNPRTEGHIFYHNDSGLFPFRAEMLNGQIGLAQYFSTNQIPRNLNGADTEIMSANMPHIIHGIEQDVMVEVFRGGTYSDSSGTLRSGISTGETVLRLKFSHDVRPRYQEGITVITGVKY